MVSAALFLLASGVGVMFGWQPMPDGTDRYEYVVQLDPELIETLEEGQSIPIASDIPEDIQPIGRIRIVVGRDQLPRQKLTTQFKPLTETGEKKSREGLLETQYTVPPVERTPRGRYGSTNSQQILPPGSSTAAGNQRFAQALQNGSQSAQNTSQILPPQNNSGIVAPLQDATQQLGNQLRSVGDTVRTDAQQLFGTNASDVVPNTLDALGDAANRLQQGVQPITQGLQQTGQQLRDTVEGVGQRTRETFDQFGRPLGEKSILSTRQNQQQSSSGTQTILPPGSAPSQQTGQIQPPRRRLDQPVNPAQGDDWQAPNWNDSQPITPGNTDQPSLTQNAAPIRPANNNPTGAFNAPWPPTPAEVRQTQVASQNPSTQPPSQQSGQPTSWPADNNNDRYNTASNSTTGTNSNNTQGDGRYGSNEPWANGPTFPSNNAQQPPSLVSDGGNPQSTTPAANPGWPAHSNQAPEIRRQDLKNPIEADFQTAGNQTPNNQPAAPTTSPAPQQPANQPLASQFGWDTNKQQAPSDTNTVPLPDNSPGSLFPLILSWVVLSGSITGNAYLFWSYLDVRNKYRSVVHNTRGSAGRYTAVD